MDRRLVRSLIALVIAAVCLGGLRLPTASAQGLGKDYLPLKVGNKWIYQVEFGGQMVEISQKVVKIDKKDGQEIATLETEISGNVILEHNVIQEQTSVTEKGVFRHSFQGMPVDPPIQALKLPFKKGETWEAKFSVQGQEFKATMKAETEEEVSVPAGKYKALVVSTEMDVGGQQISSRTWFAPKVGIVKQSFSFGGVTGSSELKKFEASEK